MPLIARFDGIDIYMYYREHNPPHFHVFHGGRKAVLEMASLKLIGGTLSPRAISKVHEWAHRNRDGLARNWVLCQAHMKPETLT